MWIVDVARDVLAYRRGVRVRKGDRVRALVDIEIGGLIYFRAPFTTSFRCRIPRGGVLRVYAAPNGWSFACTADDPSLEAAIVPTSDRRHPAYAGHALQFGLGEIGRRLEVLPSGTASPKD
jgi:hypothetical protein